MGCIVVASDTSEDTVNNRARGYGVESVCGAARFWGSVQRCSLYLQHRCF